MKKLRKKFEKEMEKQREINEYLTVNLTGLSEKFDNEMEKQREMNEYLTDRLKDQSEKFNSIDSPTFSRKLLKFDERIMRLEDAISKATYTVRILNITI